MLPKDGTVVITGGGTARVVYQALAPMKLDWSKIDIFFSDERCVPPDHDDSNYKMAKATLLDHITPRSVHRMRGEDDPEQAAAAYDSEIRPFVERGIDLTILGMGADSHIAALFPNSWALDEKERLAVAVDRPDGLKGMTLTPPALRASRRIILIATSESKTEAVRRAVSDAQPVSFCPVRLLADIDVRMEIDSLAWSAEKMS
jgi:6-phosphogluconolactonase